MAAAVPEDGDDYALVETLLGMRAFGPPPFLVRNLSYVKQDRQRARRKVWDLEWARPSSRGASTARNLIFSVGADRCILSAKAARCLSPAGALTPYQPSSYYPQTAKIRMWLSIKQLDGHHVGFGVRETSICIWPKDHLEAGVKVDDIFTKAVFDLSGVMTFLSDFPGVLTLIVELYPPNEHCLSHGVRPVMRGELLLLDVENSATTAVANGTVVIPLSLEKDPNETDTKRHSNEVPRMGFEKKAAPTRRKSARQTCNEPRDSVDADIARCGTAPARNEAVPLSESADAVTAVTATRDDSDMADNANTLADGSISLRLLGSLEGIIVRQESEFRPEVCITCSYTSPQLAWWDGIVRHDFICPWCHRNCRRLRTLMAHFHMEHHSVNFSLEGMSRSGDGNREADDRQMTMKLDFHMTAMNVPTSNAKKQKTSTRATRTRQSSRAKKRAIPDDSTAVVDQVPSVTEHVYANEIRYPRYLSTTNRSLHPGAEDIGVGMSKVAITNGADDSDHSASTEYGDGPDGDYRFPLLGDGWGKCLHCGRPHREALEGDEEFCSEWCQVVYREKQRASTCRDRASGEGTTPQDALDTEPALSTYASAPRKSRINYKETLGRRKLYHVVSVSEATEAHFDENDCDSEEEVDHSWRLQLSEELVHYLENVSPKEKVLWTMWNKFSHENFPTPVVYAERYSRHTLELFALDYRHEINRLHLRLPLVAFLRACHVHGLIDTVAVKSIMLCVDGKKKRRQCLASSRPERHHDPVPAPRKNGRDRRNRSRS